MTTAELDAPVSLSSGPSTVAPRRAFSLKKAALSLLIAAVAVAGGLSLIKWFTVGRFWEHTDDAFVGGEVTVIAPQVSGFITQVCVQDNQEVRAGDLLVRLDDVDYRARLAGANAAIGMAEAQIVNLDATRARQVALVAEAEADVVTAQADTELAQADFQRFQGLLHKDVVSTQNFQQADASLKKSISAETHARAEVNSSRSQLDVIDAQRKGAVASLDQARSQRDLAAIDVARTEIRAPISGVVGNRSARLGAFAKSGTQLLSLVPADGLWVEANFKETQVAQMHSGQIAEIRADALPGRVFRGRVGSLAPATGAQFSLLPAENATGNFTKIVQRVPVRIILEGEGARLGLLRPGLSVVASVDGRSR